MVHGLMTRFIGRNHRSNAFHCVSQLATINRLSSNASFTQLSEKEEKKIVIKDDLMLKKNIPPKYGKHVTILSLDGGGVRGIIGGVILARLEEHLQEIDGESMRLADYFDVIAGTSTGDLMTAMLTAPNDSGRPLYAAKDIVPFYLDEAPNIFYGAKCWKPYIIWRLFGPRYDGKYLHKLLGEILELA